VILETLVTTLDGAGRPNVAPLGVEFATSRKFRKPS
jgi:hypothetical protein